MLEQSAKALAEQSIKAFAERPNAVQNQCDAAEEIKEQEHRWIASESRIFQRPVRLNA
jgi:hypothetical protein